MGRRQSSHGSLGIKIAARMEQGPRSAKGPMSFRKRAIWGTRRLSCPGRVINNVRSEAEENED
ncbi:hypothetical protein BDQ94DRAFT_150074 [Aspergillus welwitschiae]|uniref:Uncharacterized protein n=1 Tax=Aspergillus welwitschiae TaxID=1341132 RepID=A0A3F3PTI9_9EURO|nr:hypothetical protein BDQ94DRAFT_150074 [Aspergillus welwitschiae]RDH29616.1 hypothetical protein BDQ94DRAFT_150074 [Aspergillus welwitschiae]